MKISIYQKKKINELKKKAIALYKTGMTTREVGKIVGRSRTWVAISVREENGQKCPKIR